MEHNRLKTYSDYESREELFKNLIEKDLDMREEINELTFEPIEKESSKLVNIYGASIFIPLLSTLLNSLNFIPRFLNNRVKKLNDKAHKITHAQKKLAAIKKVNEAQKTYEKAVDWLNNAQKALEDCKKNLIEEEQRLVEEQENEEKNEKQKFNDAKLLMYRNKEIIQNAKEETYYIKAVISSYFLEHDSILRSLIYAVMFLGFLFPSALILGYDFSLLNPISYFSEIYSGVDPENRVMTKGFLPPLLASFLLALILTQLVHVLAGKLFKEKDWLEEINRLHVKYKMSIRVDTKLTIAKEIDELGDKYIEAINKVKKYELENENSSSKLLLEKVKKLEASKSKAVKV